MSRQSGSEVPGKKFLQPVHGMIGDALEHVTQIEFRVKSVELRAAEQAVDRSSTLAASIGASEEIDDMTAKWSCRRQWLC
jgi:hypothetical protein